MFSQKKGNYSIIKNRIWKKVIEKKKLQKEYESVYLEEDILDPLMMYYKDNLPDILHKIEEYETVLTKKIDSLNEEREHVRIQITRIKEILVLEENGR